jgi:nucleoside-diphosphate-sugar epimerase
MSKRIVVFGATGATGTHLVKHALEAGLTVRAFVRSPDKLPAELRSSPNLEVFQGDLTDLIAVDKAIEGADYLVSTAGDASKTGKPMMMTAFITQAVTSMRKHGVKRLVYQAGAFSPMPGQTLPFMLRLMRPTIGGLMGMEPMLADNDSVMAYLVANASDLEWTVTRPGMIKKAPSRGALKGTTTPASGSVNFTDLAAFDLAVAQSSDFVRQAPYPSY